MYNSISQAWNQVFEIFVPILFLHAYLFVYSDQNQESEYQHKNWRKDFNFIE